jgi:hypothetical protein
MLVAVPAAQHLDGALRPPPCPSEERDLERGKYDLPLMRHPFCRYPYAIKAGWKFERYGLEQQGEIVRHTFLLRRGFIFPGAPPLATLESILPFKRSTE